MPLKSVTISLEDLNSEAFTLDGDVTTSSQLTEIADILANVVSQIRKYENLPTILRDTNGNRVGCIEVSYED